jgi:Acetyltransferase (GNAT) domain
MNEIKNKSGPDERGRFRQFGCQERRPEERPLSARLVMQTGSDSPRAAESSLDQARHRLAEIEAKVVDNEDDRQAIFRLRYEVYIAEQGKPYSHADHAHRALRDADDDWAGALVLVRIGGRPCATVRATHLGDSRAFEACRRRFELDAFAAWPRDQMVVCSRLAVLPEFRRGPAGRAVFDAIYRYELGRGVRFCFQFCATRLRPLFLRYGFREYLPAVDDPVIGAAHRMALLLDDVEHLRSSRSPFLAAAREKGVTSESRPWFAARFAEVKRRA